MTFRRVKVRRQVCAGGPRECWVVWRGTQPLQHYPAGKLGRTAGGVDVGWVRAVAYANREALRLAAKRAAK